jgi:putative aldouronate transport system permease protein
VTMVRLGMKNSFLAYILPSAVVVFFVILIKTYIEQIPKELDESARMDGAGPLRIFASIVLPLCGPILATIAIFSAVNQWNAWQDNLYLVSNPKLQTLQFVLLRYLADQTANMMAIKARTSSAIDVTVVELTPTSIRMTITMIVTLPILFVYPFFQRYFVSGIMIGAVKG